MDHARRCVRPRVSSTSPLPCCGDESLLARPQGLSAAGRCRWFPSETASLLSDKAEPLCQWTSGVEVDADDAPEVLGDPLVLDELLTHRDRGLGDRLQVRDLGAEPTESR